MRCGAASTVYVYTNPTSGSRVGVTVLTVGAEGSSCSGSQYAVLSQAEFDQFTASPFRLTLAEGGQISAAILLVWAAGWAFRQLVRVVMHTDTPPAHD